MVGIKYVNYFKVHVDWITGVDAGDHLIITNLFVSYIFDNIEKVHVHVFQIQFVPKKITTRLSTSIALKIVT